LFLVRDVLLADCFGERHSPARESIINEPMFFDLRGRAMPKLDGVFGFEGIKPIERVGELGFLCVERKKHGNAISQWEWLKLGCRVVFSFHARMDDTSLLVDKAL
jgi:hypothetical protein